jgi:hypothetical protein
MRAAPSDRDLVVIEEMLAPPPLHDARSSLEFWERRRSSLPLYRLSARREARIMAARWHDRVRAAELARFEATLVGRLLGRFGIARLWFGRPRVGRGGFVSIAWAVGTRRYRPVVGGRAAAFVFALAALTALILIAQS